MKRVAREIWLINDPMGEVRVFNDEKQAEELNNKWKQEEGEEFYNVFCFLTKPTKYILAE